MKFLNRVSTGWLLTVGVMLFLLLPPLFQEGMFIDGIFYATLSRNLAAGLGSFWEPYFSATYEPSSFAHPPLAFGLESLLFRLVGDHFWVERLFSFLTALSGVLAMGWVWRGLAPAQRSWAWLPVLGWILTPRVFWSYQHNMLENLLTLWSLLAVGMIVQSFGSRRGFIFAVSAGLFVGLGFLTKGLVGLFPLVVPLTYGLILGKPWRTWLTMSLGMALGLGLVVLFLRTYEPALRFFEAYYHKQVWRSFNGEMEVYNSLDQGSLLLRMLEELLPSLGLALGATLFLARYGRLQNLVPLQIRPALFALCIGFAASLPLMVSPKLRDFYLVPAFPYFALAWSLLLAGGLAALRERFLAWRKILNPLLLAFLLAVGAYSVYAWQRPMRDETLLADIHTLGAVIPSGTTVHICPELERQWTLRFYLSRYYQISQDFRHAGTYPFWISDLSCPADTGLVDLALPLQGLRLYRR